MRLHHLTVTAFGPFAGSVEVDLDALSAGGLFLLTGATGAGKSSVLDAVCFALYGQVPGDRAGAKHLRSDHAEAHVAPEVRLDVSIGERRFLFTRSPAWARPKLRGTGQTKVQAHVVVEEHRDGSWTVLTNRLDDAGLLVTDLLGMTAAQFTQVAMLPQGRFQAFLRASSAERHAVLQQLFRTDRFERVERWLVERRTSTRRAAEAQEHAARETVDRLREAAGSEGLPEWAEDLDSAAEDDVLRWAGGLRTDADDALAQTTGTAEATAARHADAAAALAAATRVEEHRARGLAAREELAALAASAAERGLLVARLDAHDRARGVVPLADAAAGTRQRAEDAARTWSERRRGLVATFPDLDEDALDQRLAEARSAYTRAVAFEPRARARAEAAARRAEVRNRLQAVETGVAETELALAEKPRLIAEAVSAVHEARAAAARLPVVTARAEQLDALVHAARRAEVLRLEVTAARTDLLAATQVALSAKERYLEVREQRINGMAGELAGQLASGCSCPVCGSADHPAPAQAAGTVVGRAEEERARKESETAAFEVQAREVGLAGLEAELAGLETRLEGTDVAALPAERSAAYDEIERLEPLVAALDVLAAREEECRARIERAERDRSDALLERATLSAELDQLEAVLDAIAEEWADLLDAPGAAPDEEGSAPLTEVVAARARLTTVLETAVRERDARAETAAAAQDALQAAEAAAREAGFTDLDAALAAVLPPEEAQHAAGTVREAEVREHAARLTLADPAVVAALAASPAALDELRATCDTAAGAATAAVSARDAAAARRSRVAALVAELGARLDAWRPLRAEHRTVAGLAALVEGKSVDNPLRMRLAAYVLAERLHQVVAAANERLATMTDQRYLLEHTDDRGYGEQRGGLSLRVRDDWNGVRRDPATLSGGETFVVSLALALGLADTVAHEAGGVDIDTLFIDEGFGSLDADTLEDVMDTLDSLRDGGRVVGLVSHVPELRSRVTIQLEVVKGRTGSSVRAAYAAR